MKINTLRTAMAMLGLVKPYVAILLITSFMSSTALASQTASSVLDHAVNLSGAPTSQSFSENNGGITFSSGQSAPNEPDASIVKGKIKAPPVIQKPKEIVKSKKSDKSSDSEMIASLNNPS